jgi:hypothetical protein
VIKAMLLVAYLARLARERPITAADRTSSGPMRDGVKLKSAI